MTLIDYIKNQSEDTLFRGAFCGLTAGILKNLIDYILYTLKLKEVVFWHYASILAFHKPPHGLLMHATALIQFDLVFCQSSYCHV